MTLQLTSSAFAQGHPIPKKYTGEGADVSPPLAWSGLAGRHQGIGADLRRSRCPDDGAVGSLGDLQDSGRDEGTAGRRSPQGAAEGTARRAAGEELLARRRHDRLPRSDAPARHGVHHYYFKLYAVEAHMVVEPGLDRRALMDEISDHILAEGVLMGTYER